MSCRVRYNGAAPEDSFTATIRIPFTEHMDGYARANQGGLLFTGKDYDDQNLEFVYMPSIYIGTITSSYRYVDIGISYNSSTKTATISSCADGKTTSSWGTQSPSTVLMGKQLGFSSDEIPIGRISPGIYVQKWVINGWCTPHFYSYANTASASVNMTRTGVHLKPWTIVIDLSYFPSSGTFKFCPRGDNGSELTYGIYGGLGGTSRITKQITIKYDPVSNKIMENSGQVYFLNYDVQSSTSNYVEFFHSGVSKKGAYTKAALYTYHTVGSNWDFDGNINSAPAPSGSYASTATLGSFNFD